MDLRLRNWSFNFVHSFQHFYTALSLSSRLFIVAVPVYESFELPDPVLLVFVSRKAHFHALSLLFEVKIIIPCVFVERPLLDFNYALNRSIEKSTIVRDQDKSRRAVQKIIFQPQKAFEIEVVCRLVEQ